MFEVVVTGASGFIGSALLQEASGVHDGRLAGLDWRPPQGPNGSFFRADIRRSEELSRLKDLLGCRALIHLAAKATAMVPWKQAGDLFDTNVAGLWNTLEALKPRIAIFASTCAVYGSTSGPAAEPVWDAVRPVGLYGASKAAGELILRDWAREHGTSAVIFRFGNVIGPACRGLIPYLVQHAVRHPGGAQPAQMRGAGRIVRDYVPVESVVRIMLAAAWREWPAGETSIFNIGAGRTLSNGTVARWVTDTLRGSGLPLSISFDNPLGWGEARRVSLSVDKTTAEFGCAPARLREVKTSVESAVWSHLKESGHSERGHGG